mgnify:CR=1 FL=1
MLDTPLHWLSIGTLSRMIHDGSLSPVAVMEHFLGRVEGLNDNLGAFHLVSREMALDGARAAELALRSGHDAGPLHGIPFAVKDIIDVRDLPTSAGSKALEGSIASRDATVVASLRRAGMVLLGKTRTVQFALGAPGINRSQGTPHNPWSRAHHVPGGSSSGSAVAVAAGLVPMALGTDTGGSVRIPASLCGTVGLKPTASQVSRAGVFPLSQSLDSVGPLSRCVKGAALAHSAIVGVDPRDPMTAHAIQPDTLRDLTGGVKGLRVGVAEGRFNDDLDPPVARAVEQAVCVFERLGAAVRPLALPQAERALEANPRLLISSVEAACAHAERLPNFEHYDATLEFRLHEGRTITGVEYVRARRATAALADEAHDFLKDFDVFLSPTTPSTARPLDEVDGSIEAYQHWNARYSRNTVIGNLLGLCAVSVPCGIDDDGLPIGLMIHAKRCDEATALRAAQAFESATDWSERVPDLSWTIAGPT